MRKLSVPNDGTRTLVESIAIPEVAKALRDFEMGVGDNCVLVGGCALCYYTRPRMTTDIDVLFLKSADIPTTINKFKHNRLHAFEHRQTGVEVEVLTPEHINLPKDIAEKVFSTAILANGLKIASPTGLVAMKLQRLKFNDIGDIIGLIETGRVDLTGWPISEKNIKDLELIKNQYM